MDGFGGMVGFELKGSVDESKKFIKRLQIPIHAPSLGGVESSITRPAESSHLAMSAEERKQAGISDSLIRFSVGIENVEDLIEDLKKALK